MTHTDLPPTDRGALERLHRFGGAALLSQMIALFLEAAPARIAAARAGSAACDAQAVELALHSLKSSSAQLGAMRMQRLSERGEAHARAGTLDAITAIVEELDEELGRVRAWLTTARAGDLA